MAPVVGFFVLLVLGLSRWNTGLVTNYDLGIFAQSAQDYAAGRLPSSDIRQLPLLGDHFSPILALNGLAWRLWPDPRVLIAVQAALIAGAAALIGAFAQRMLGQRWAWGITAMFLLGPGVVAAALFDFHETAYAAPLLAFACVALARRHWWAVVVTSVILLTVKEDMGLTVMGVACCWLVMGRSREWRRALLLAALGVVGIVAATLVIAAINPAGGSEYLGMFGLGEKRAVAGQVTGSALDAHRLMPIAAYTVMTGVIGWRSPLSLVALPTLLWRTVSSNPLYWTPEFHYDLLPAVVAAVALTHVLSGRRGRHRERRRVGAVVLVCAVVTCTMSLVQADHRLPRGIALQENARVQDVRALGAHVPAAARVAALNDVGAYLIADHTHVHQLQVDHPEPVRYVIFTDGPEWADRYPRAAREALVEGARSTPGMRLWRSGDVTLVDLGREQSVSALAR